MSNLIPSNVPPIPQNSNSIGPSDPSSSSAPVSSVSPADAKVQAAARESIASEKKGKTPSRGPEALRVVRNHFIVDLGHPLSRADRKNVARVCKDENSTPKQRLREDCLADTTIHKLICPSDHSTGRALSILPGTLQDFIDDLTDDQAEELLKKLDELIDPKTGKLIEPDPGKVLLNACKAENTVENGLLAEFLCAAGPTCAAVEQGLKKTDETGQTTLMHAIESKSITIVEALLEFANTLGCTSELMGQTNPNGWTAFMFAAEVGDGLMLDALYKGVDEGLSGNRAYLFTQSNRLGQIPVMVATRPEATRFLIEKGVEEGAGTSDWFLSARDQNGRTALCWAVMIAGAELAGARFPDGELVSETFARKVDVLLELGARPADRDHEGATVLMHAANTGNVPLAEKLLNSMNEVDRARLLEATDTNDRTTFMHAVLGREGSEMLNFLFETTPPDNRVNLFRQQDIEGNTPLMLAAIAGLHEGDLMALANSEQIDMSEIMSIRNQEGLTVVELAARRREQEEEAVNEEEAVVNIHMPEENGNPPG